MVLSQNIISQKVLSKIPISTTKSFLLLPKNAWFGTANISYRWNFLRVKLDPDGPCHDDIPDGRPWSCGHKFLELHCRPQQRMWPFFFPASVVKRIRKTSPAVRLNMWDLFLRWGIPSKSDLRTRHTQMSLHQKFWSLRLTRKQDILCQILDLIDRKRLKLVHAIVFFIPRAMGISPAVPKLSALEPKFQNLELRSFASISGSTYALPDWWVINMKRFSLSCDRIFPSRLKLADSRGFQSWSTQLLA